jgi:uncharacterized lipoprotein YajG
MKRIYILLVLVSLVAGAVLTGCGESPSSTTTTPATNAPMPAAETTNK